MPNPNESLFPVAGPRLPGDVARRLAEAPVAATKVPMPPVDAAKAAAAVPGPDSLKTHMPAGELGVRNLPGETLSTVSGGTSKAEDTTRAAGYVADLTKTNEPPPGPPIAKEPSNFAGPEAETVPPVKRVKSPATAGPTPPLPDPAGSDPAPRPTPPTPADPADPATHPARVESTGARGDRSSWPRE